MDDQDSKEIEQTAHVEVSNESSNLNIGNLNGETNNVDILNCYIYLFNSIT